MNPKSWSDYRQGNNTICMNCSGLFCGSDELRRKQCRQIVMHPIRSILTIFSFVNNSYFVSEKSYSPQSPKSWLLYGDWETKTWLIVYRLRLKLSYNIMTGSDGLLNMYWCFPLSSWQIRWAIEYINRFSVQEKLFSVSHLDWKRNSFIFNWNV